MRAVKRGALAATVVLMATVGVQAQTLRKDDGPAELPPSSYKSDQYVDSKGCVYIRAGYAGQVSWVPRVTRGRDVMCGFRPTFAKAKPVAPAPKAATAKTVAKPAPKAKTQTVAKPAPQTKTIKKVVRKPVAGAPAPAAPTQKKVIKKKVVPQQKKRVVCPGASELSQRYINGGARCGPQTTSPYDSGALQAPDGTRQVARLPAPQVPKGYKVAWSDDRLNPNRGTGTAQGEAAMNQVWSQTVPRVRVAASPEPSLVARVSTKSALKAPKVVVRKKPVLATPTPKTKVTTSARLIQVGSYGDPRNAKATIQRLQAMGLPVRVSKAKIKGKPVQVIFAGPVKGTQLNSALGAVRKAGYRDAFVR